MATFTYVTINDPLGTQSTEAEGLNNSGEIVGIYVGANGVTYGFLYSDGTFTTIDDPSSVGNTYAYGINDAGQIVGSYGVNTVTLLEGTVSGSLGFLYSDGSFTNLNVPASSGSQFGGPGTYASGINDSGEVVGSFTVITSEPEINGTSGFLYSGGNYAGLQDTSGEVYGLRYTIASGINPSGQIVGSFENGSGVHGFLYSGGTYTNIDDPSATMGTVASGINDSGQIVGTFYNATGAHGFLYSGGTYTTLDDPLATQGTIATGINDLGQFVGYYVNASGTYGFELTLPTTPIPLSVITTAFYFEHGFALTISPDFALTDPVSSTLVSATVTVSGGTFAGDGDQLTATTSGTSIAASYKAATETLTLTGTDTLLDYQTVLDSVTFQSTSANPTNDGADSARTITWSLNDGTEASAPISTTVNIEPPNPLPPPGTVSNIIMTDGNGDYTIYDVGDSLALTNYSLGNLGTQWQLKDVGDFFGSDISDMIFWNSSTGVVELYDVSNNNVTSGATLAIVGGLGPNGLGWQVAGFGDFSTNANETDMMLFNSNNGVFEVYDISNNSVTGASEIAQVGSGWGIAGFGDFSTNANETDMMLFTNSNSGVFEVYDISHGTIVSAAEIAQVGLGWQVAGFGDFSTNANETDMMLFNSNNGVFEVYNISHGTIVSAAEIARVGLGWQVAGFGDFSTNVNETDMMLFNSNNSVFEVYDISHGTITSAAEIAVVGPGWVPVGFGNFSGNNNETDMLLRNINDGALEVYDISHSEVTYAGAFANPGVEWHIVGIVPSSSIQG